MADVYFNSARQAIAAGNILLLTDTLKVLLVKSGYTVNADHDTVSQITPGTNEISVSGYARQTLANKSVTEDDTNDRAIFDADDVVFTSLVAGETVVAAILFKDTGSDATSKMIGYYDVTDTPTNGGTITISWASTGLFLF